MGSSRWNGGGTGGDRQITILDRTGKVISKAGQPGVWPQPSVSPAGDKVVVRSFDPRGRLTPITIIDLKTGYATRLTFYRRTAWHPVWSGDGRSIAYGLSSGIGRADVMVRNLVSGSERRLWEGDRSNWLQDWSRDGRMLLFTAPAKAGTGFDLAVLPVEGEKAGDPYTVITAEGNIWGRFSPDGKWLVYCIDAAGQFEILVKKMLRPGGESVTKWPVGSGGIDPRWSSDGS